MSTKSNTRPTHKSLPALIIPRGRRSEPEEISASQVTRFLKFCDMNKRAPITRLPDLALLPAPGTPDSGTTWNGDKGTEHQSNTSRYDESQDPETIAFTDRESVDLAALQEQLAKVKLEHTDLYLETSIEPNNREIMLKCRQTRLKREKLNSDIAEIFRKRGIRRDFRRDANNIKGVSNW
ncbi:hypothetical protein F5Y11DRAFT_349577 [Daldinia sp. FL1419]|nr:hypothetical protein F5Y11DRAFT_349577 [Daldinia sp. FL1419]